MWRKEGGFAVGRCLYFAIVQGNFKMELFDG
jgi:hypothetical protein